MGYRQGYSARGDEDQDWLVGAATSPEAAERLARRNWPDRWGPFPPTDQTLRWGGRLDGKEFPSVCLYAQEVEVET